MKLACYIWNYGDKPAIFCPLTALFKMKPFKVVGVEDPDYPEPGVI